MTISGHVTTFVTIPRGLEKLVSSRRTIESEVEYALQLLFSRVREVALDYDLSSFEAAEILDELVPGLGEHYLSADS